MKVIKNPKRYQLVDSEMESLLPDMRRENEDDDHHQQSPITFDSDQLLKQISTF